MLSYLSEKGRRLEIAYGGRGMYWQDIVKYVSDNPVWLWAISPSGILLIWLIRGLLHHLTNRTSKPKKLFDSEDGMKFYEYWRDGYDLDSEQLVDFIMDFGDREKANSVALGLTRKFDIIESNIEKSGIRWRLTITLRIVPSSAQMDTLRLELSDAAGYAGGTYHGWTLRG